jgi:hypothetical protein
MHKHFKHKDISHVFVYTPKCLVYYFIQVLSINGTAILEALAWKDSVDQSYLLQHSGNNKRQLI